MRNPIVNQIQYKKPMRNPSYEDLVVSSFNEQTIHQVIACDAILATKLKHNRKAMMEVASRLADHMNIINMGETYIGTNTHPINKWVDHPHLKTTDQDTDWVPNCN